MKIFVTGGSGFIGSHFIKQALISGHSILALRRPASSTPRITWHHQPAWLDSSIENLSADDLQECDALVHFAAVGVSPRLASWSELQETNIKATLKMCLLAKQVQSCLVVSGSYAEYGLSGLRYKKIPPSAPLEPNFPYAASKAAAGLLAMSYGRSENISVSWLRIFNAYGDGQHESNLWPSLRLAAMNGVDFPMTGGEQIRDFIPVEDVASLFLLEAESLVHSQKPSVIAKNIGSGKPQTILQFSRYWWERWGAAGKLLVGALPYRENEVMRYVPEI